MSKKTVTTTNQTQNQTQAATFDPASLNAYHSLLAPAQSALTDYMQNPLQSTAFDQRNQLANQNAFALASRNKSNILANSGTFASGNMPAYLQSALGRNSRALSATQSNSFLQNLLYADQTRQSATNSALGFRPLQTGGTSSGTMSGTQTQQTSGLGTWLPQLVGAGLGIAGTLAGGGIGKAAGATSGLFSGGSSSAMSGSIANNNAFIGGLDTYQPSTNNYWKNS